MRINAPAFICLAVGVYLAGCGGARYRADAEYADGEYRTAQKAYAVYLKNRPDDHAARKRYGFACLKTGRTDRAEAAFRRVLQANPGDAEALLYLGLALLNRNEPAAALRVWRTDRDLRNPEVEAEIQRLSKLVQIAHAQNAARAAISAERSKQLPIPDTESVAVLEYQTLLPKHRYSGLGKALQAMVITGLSRFSVIRVIERTRISALLREAALMEAGITRPETVVRAGRLLGAGQIVKGSITGDPASEKRFRVTTVVVSVTGGQVRFSTTITADAAGFIRLPDRIATEIASGLFGISEKSDSSGRGRGTKRLKALSYYGEALSALDAGNWKRARDLLAAALKEDPRFAAARERLDECPDIYFPSPSELADVPGSRIAELLTWAAPAPSVSLDIRHPISPAEWKHPAEKETIRSAREVRVDSVPEPPPFPEPPAP